MKTLIINGSPRKNGDTKALLNELAKHLGGETITIDTYYDDIKPCTDCRYCWSHDKCVFNDRMQEVYKLINEVDNIIIASPIYFSQLTGPLLSFASRLQYLWVSRCIRKDKAFKLTEKNGAIILVGGGDGSSEPAIKMASILLNQMNCKIIGTVCSLNTNIIPAIDDTIAMSKIKAMAEILY